MSLDNLIVDGDFATLFLWFSIYSFLGWIWESSYRTIHRHKLTNSGFLMGPFIPIYGFGALLYIALMHISLNPFFLFFVGSFLACVLEYATSWVLEKLFHARWWDYSKEMLNINGRVCLIGFLAFGGFAIILPYLHLVVSSIVASLEEGWLISSVVVIALLLIYDLTLTIHGLIKFNKTLERIQKEFEQQAKPFIDLVRKGKDNLEIRYIKSKERANEVLTRQQQRILREFPSFKSMQYPEAFKRVRKLYSESLKKHRKKH